MLCYHYQTSQLQLVSVLEVSTIERIIALFNLVRYITCLVPLNIACEDIVFKNYRSLEVF